MFSGDLVEYNAGIYTGDAQLTEWPETLENLRAFAPVALVPGRGPSIKSAADSLKAIDFTQNFVHQLLFCAKKGLSAGKNLTQVYKDTLAKLDPIYGQFLFFFNCKPTPENPPFSQPPGFTN